MLRLLVRKIDLNQHTRAIGGLACSAVHTLKQFKTVDRLDPRERRGRAPGFVRLVRRGKTFAYLLLASHYDEEDIATMTDPSFWKMIHESEKGLAIPWEQVKAELVGMNGSRTRKSKITNGRKGKRNVAA